MNRFDRNVEKLYKAFNEGTLNAFSCHACAVGNIVGHGKWIGYSSQELIDGLFSRDSSNWRKYPKDAEYSPKELREIEFIFLKRVERC